MIRADLSNITKVRSTEDIMDARCERIEIIVPAEGGREQIILTANAKSARALARFLNRHANFITRGNK